MTDARLKIWIELGKWAVVSVGLVLMTKIIDTGFKDREVGLNEINEYDKYVAMVTDNTKLSERRLLAQYFAYVTPSDKLKKGWSDYFAVVDQEFQALQAERRNKEEKLAELARTADSSGVQDVKAQILRKEIDQMNYELTPTFNKSEQVNDYEAALSWEKIGFESLLNKDLDGAIMAFQNCENSYGGFHQVYEIGRFLKSKRNSGEQQNNQFWNSIYETLLNNYSWKMPEDIKNRLKALVQ